MGEREKDREFKRDSRTDRQTGILKYKHREREAERKTEEELKYLEDRDTERRWLNVLLRNIIMRRQRSFNMLMEASDRSRSKHFKKTL